MAPVSVISRTTVSIVEAWELGSGGKGEVEEGESVEDEDGDGDGDEDFAATMTV